MSTSYRVLKSSSACANKCYNLFKSMKFYGLSENEVLKLRARYGENVISAKEGQHWFSILASQLKSPLIYILFFVIFISLLFGKNLDAFLIGSVVVLNSLMGFFQEYKAQKTLIALSKILKPKALVIRQGQRKEIEAKDLVPRDLVVLGEGDKVPADGRLIQGTGLLLNEAILTGEEEGLEKTPDKEKGRLFMGTTVIAGAGLMEVEKIGQETAIGKIQTSLSEIEEEKTPLEAKLEEFSKNLALLILIICLFIFLIGLTQAKDLFETFRFSVILAVAAIPEGLPIAITAILTLGVRRILKRNGLVKRLISIETLGATSVICTDKTGTLTEGRMQVFRTDFKDMKRAFAALALTNEQRTNLEAAIWNYLKKEGADPQNIFDEAERIYEEPFDSGKKYALTINKIEGKETAFILGASEIVLSFCRPETDKKSILEKIEKWADEGLKVLGIAFKETGVLAKKDGFLWLGLIAIKDPVRKEVKEAVASAYEAGIKVKIVTGDFLRTAIRVAKELGFKLTAKNVMEGRELEAISDDDLKNKIDDILIFSRVTPSQKQKIIKVLQAKGEIVAMTGDGVNDAPALKKADIGVAVGSACEVARETADLILLDGNFKTIVAAVEEGRLIFSNIKKTVAYILSNSFVEIFLILGAMLLNLPYPLTIVQILWLHLICDGPPDIMLSFEPKEKDLMKLRPEKLKKEEILDKPMKFLILAISLTISLLCLLLFWYILRESADLKLGQTLAFATVATADLIYVFSFKNLKKSIFKTENFFQNKLPSVVFFFENKFLIFGVAYGFLLTLSAIYLPFLNRVLGTVPLDLFYWLPVLGVATVTILWTETVKVVSNSQSKIT